MNNCHPLLSLLADGDYRSGAEIGRLLSISRSAVWKQVRRFQEDGVDIEACHHRGYRIPGGLSLLKKSSILEKLDAPASRCLAALDVQDRVSSTNDLAMGRVKAGGADGYVCLAETQVSGKGRRGRTWVSPYGANIYLSLVKNFAGGAASVEGLSLAVGLSVIRALRSLGYADIGLKWPNDILCSKCKLGGVLLEIVGDPAGICDVIVGVGINVNMPARAGSVIKEQEWIDLRALKKCAEDRNFVAAALINQLLPLLFEFEDRGFAHYQKEWQSLDALRDENVVLYLGDQKVTGIARGVNTSGALQIDTLDGRQSYSGGEISLRSHQ